MEGWSLGQLRETFARPISDTYQMGEMGFKCCSKLTLQFLRSEIWRGNTRFMGKETGGGDEFLGKMQFSNSFSGQGRLLHGDRCTVVVFLL